MNKLGDFDKLEKHKIETKKSFCQKDKPNTLTKISSLFFFLSSLTETLNRSNESITKSNPLLGCKSQNPDGERHIPRRDHDPHRLQKGTPIHAQISVRDLRRPLSRPHPWKQSLHDTHQRQEAHHSRSSSLWD